MIARLVEDTGSQGTPVVYVPGIDGTGAFLFGTAACLAERFRLVRVRYEREPGEPCDARGYGRLAASLAALLDERRVGPAILLAESFGVALALRTALDHPERVRALMLVNGFARYERRGRIGLAARLSRFLPAGLFDLGRRWLAPAMLFGPRRTPEVVRAFRELSDGRFDDGYRCRLAMIADVDLLPELGRVRVPVRILASDRDLIVPAERSATRMAEALPRARVERLEGAGHVALPFDGERWRERLERLAREVPGEPAGDGPRDGARPRIST